MNQVLEQRKLLLKIELDLHELGIDTSKNYGDRGGGVMKKHYAWFEMIKNRYCKHTFKINPQEHPKYIKNKLLNLQEDQFAYSAFGLKDLTKRPAINYLKGYREKFINPILLKRYNYVKYENPS